MPAFPFPLVLLLPALLLTSTTTAWSEEKIGTSCADCPDYRGAFSIENQTGVTIPYQVRWGEKHPWQQMSLQSGHIKTHSYPLGEDPHAKIRIPYVRYDAIGGDGQFTPQEYRIRFHAVGYAGYGPAANRTEPKRYIFKYGANGRTLNLFAR